MLNDFQLQCLKKFVCPKWLIARIHKSKIKHSEKAEVIFIKSEINKINDPLFNLKKVINVCSIKQWRRVVFFLGGAGKKNFLL